MSALETFVTERMCLICFEERCPELTCIEDVNVYVTTTAEVFPSAVSTEAIDKTINTSSCMVYAFGTVLNVYRPCGHCDLSA